MLILELTVLNFFFILLLLLLLLDVCLKSFYTKFQVNILQHTIAITEKPERQSLVFHPVILLVLSCFNQGPCFDQLHAHILELNTIASALRCVRSADQNMASHNRPLFSTTF